MRGFKHADLMLSMKRTSLEIEAVRRNFGESDNQGAIDSCDSSGVIPLQVVGRLAGDDTLPWSMMFLIRRLTQ